MLPERSQRLRPKILGLLGAGILSVGLIAAVAIWLLSSQIARYNQLVQQEISATALSDNINLNFKRQVQEGKNVLLRGHEPHSAGSKRSHDQYYRPAHAQMN